MSWKTFSFLTAPLLLLSCTPMLAQSTPPPANPPAQTRMGGRGGTPCWQQAGIDKSVMEQRWALERDTRSQVEAVCSNSSLTPQQKQQQAREIHQQAKTKMEGLVTADQEKALTACQQQRGMNHTGMGGGAGREGGGCGEWPHHGVPPSGAAGGASGNPPPPSQPPQN
jgi:hypothetical protein